MEKIRTKVIISGIVQGVLFRYHTCKQAEKINLTGWVKNRRDGKVEILVEGEKENIEELITWCRQGPPGALVKDVKVEWQEYKGEFNHFSIEEE